MLRLYKACMARLLTNIFFIGGCVIALVVTFAVSSGWMRISFLSEADSSRRMFFVSIAMCVFFSIFVPYSISPEYKDGVLRNKMIIGYTQKQIFGAYYLSHASLLFLMTLAYLIGGILGGADPFGRYGIPILTVFVAFLFYLTVLCFISFRVKNVIVVAVVITMLFQAAFGMTMFGNAILMAFDNAGNIEARNVTALIYNLSPFGQWFSNTGFSDDYANPGTAAQLLLSVGGSALVLFAGTLRLNLREEV
ncbi:MAG: hypothetical protein K6E50_04660 [Lachnospiraceae bacterium]|nr:hypothetical protein [Lachnospiraceae bacterium]